VSTASARDEILGRIRESLAHIEPLQRAPGPGLSASHPPRATLVEEFQRALIAADGQVHPVKSFADAAPVLAQRMAAARARSILSSDTPEIRALLAAAGCTAVVTPQAEREELLAAELGLTQVQFAIAETGTLVLASPDEPHRLASLLPRVHVALLHERDIVPGLGEALDKLASGILPVATFITGPSRTGDIELTLVVGVHGPQELHVILVADGPAMTPG
jgi:L-lactate dehydrogenase complex protein LldG